MRAHRLNLKSSCGSRLAPLLRLLLCWFVSTGALADAADAHPSSLRVVSDDNFPPYLFRNADGHVEGFLVDLWALWERKTGVRVRSEERR